MIVTGSDHEELDRRLFRDPTDNVSILMEVTPQLAAHWLARRNRHNRPLGAYKVARFAAMIKAGKFRVTNQGIGFDTDGILADGQNRLHGVVKADRPIICYVTFGLDPEVRKDIDVSGFGARTPGDVASMFSDIKNPRLAALAVNAIRRFVYRTPSAMSHDELLSQIEIYRYGLTWMSDNIASGRLGVGPVVAALTVAYMRHPAEVHAAYADMKRARELMHPDPIHTYMRWFSNLRRIVGVDAEEACDKLLAAIYKRVRGESATILRPTPTVISYFRSWGIAQ